MKVVVAQSVVGECVDVWRADQATEAFNLREAHIVEQEDDDIRSAFFGPLLGRPPFLGVAIGFSYYATEPFNILGFYTRV